MNHSSGRYAEEILQRKRVAGSGSEQEPTFTPVSLMRPLPRGEQNWPLAECYFTLTTSFFKNVQRTTELWKLKQLKSELPRYWLSNAVITVNKVCNINTSFIRVIGCISCISRIHRGESIGYRRTGLRFDEHRLSDIIPPLLSWRQRKIKLHWEDEHYLTFQHSPNGLTEHSTVIFSTQRTHVSHFISDEIKVLLILTSTLA